MVNSKARDPERTRRRILDAATGEFARYGLGGARVDRIASRAGANKRMLYYYFGDKDRLFLAALELWHAARIVGQLEENDLELFASGLSDPDLSLAASVHLFAAAGLTRPAALNGPQYIEGRGTTDKRFRAERNSIRVPSAPGLGIELGAGAQRALTMAAAQA